MNKQIGIFIPARLSSERLPNKLVLPIGDTCLFDIACKKLNTISNKYNKYVLISDKELIEIATKYNNIKIIIRDKSTTVAEGPLSFIFNDMKNVVDTHLMFLNPCLAFLTKETILKALNDFSNSTADYGTSVKILQNWIFDSCGKSLNDINYHRLTTKEIKPILEAAHCFHIFNKEQFFEDGMMLKEGFMPLLIPKEETIDVDTKDEYEYAKWKWENL